MRQRPLPNRPEYSEEQGVVFLMEETGVLFTDQSKGGCWRVREAGGGPGCPVVQPSSQSERCWACALCRPPATHTPLRAVRKMWKQRPGKI